MASSSVVYALGTDAGHGLADQEAATRLEKFGANEMLRLRRRGAWSILVRQFRSVMIVILLVAGAASAATGDYKDALAIMAMVVLNTALGFRQEYRAERALEAIERLSVPHAIVRRSGGVETISARDLVPGDIVLLEAGNLVPADARLIDVHNLRTNESILTGESEPVQKEAEYVAAEEAPVSDRLNMAYLGTTVIHGRGAAVVVHTGKDTELGRISSMLQEVDERPTRLQILLDRLGRKLALAALAVVAIIFAAGLARGEEWRTLFLTSISLAVAAVPEGLPTVIVIALALGSQRMLKRHALIRQLTAIETLGSVTVICSDKTGTLTENRMTVTRAFAGGRGFDLRGGQETDPALLLLLACGALSTDVTAIRRHEHMNEERWSGDPTEVALVRAAESHGLDKDFVERILPRVDEVPFDSHRKRMTTVHRIAAPEAVGSLMRPASGNLHSGVTHLAITKGAADSLLDHSLSVWSGGRAEPLTDASRQQIRAATDQMASEGSRVLGVAFRLWNGTPRNGEEIECHLVFLGLVGMLDPARPEAKVAVETCNRAGIRPIMVTGDHSLTAQSIAREIGIGDGRAVLTGAEMCRLSGADLARKAADTAVCARVSPEDKLALVEALQAAGHVVAMTGDGVNDAPALAKADVGIAMGQAGTDAAREASDIVLEDDNFATIVAAIEEGRVIYDNIRKFVRYLLTCNSGELWVVLLAPLAGMPLPLTPLQILWMNLVTDGLPALALGLEPAEPGTMRRPPRPPHEDLLGMRRGISILAIGLLLGATALLSGYRLWSGHQPEWQTAVFTVATLSQLGLALACRSETVSVFRRGMASNRPLLGAVAGTLALQMLIIYVPFFQSAFGTRALPPFELGICLALSTVPFWGAELEKVGHRSERLRP